jgi:hypothetical protein
MMPQQNNALEVHLNLFLSTEPLPDAIPATVVRFDILPDVPNDRRAVLGGVINRLLSGGFDAAMASGQDGTEDSVVVLADEADAAMGRLSHLRDTRQPRLVGTRKATDREVRAAWQNRLRHILSGAGFLRTGDQ